MTASRLHRFQPRLPAVRHPHRFFLAALLPLLGLLLAILSTMVQAATTTTSTTETITVAPGQSYLVFCYHSVPATANGSAGANSTTNFAGQLAWLRSNGYTAISMDDILRAKAGQRPLPQKSFLLTVDDGYEDFYVNVFPLLKLYKIPAVFGLVGRWIEDGRDPKVSQSDPGYASQQFVNWAQVREMSDSGLVEMASHSYDLHHGILANPQHNTEPAAVTQEYDPDKQSYETPDQRRLRVRSDLRKNSALIARHTGIRPRIMVWPYGAVDRISAEEAAAAGMPINFTLTDGVGSTLDTAVIPRNLIGDELPLTSFTYMVTHEVLQDNADAVRAIKISLDRVYDPDPTKEDEKLGRMLDQTARLGINTVLLQPFAAPASGRFSSEAYFPNSVLPMRADLLNRVAWQFRSRLGVDVFILIDTAKVARIESGIPHPLDISDREDREHLLNLYSELSLASPAQGLMFDTPAVDGAQFNFYVELLGRSSYIRPPMLFYAAGDENSADAIIHLSFSHAMTGASDRVAFPAPVDAPPDKMATFVRQLPANRAGILSLPVKGASIKQLENVVENMSFFQRHGVSDFMLDDDTFMDDPVKFDMLRKAVSLKNNPLLTPGK
ncbi:poly-beta-1,6-N-acetyl-D-glucosamine N-deacetylase PgaB [Herbaspirillum sp. RV1423]|uniref:poly-beta-1,6-N-acetyl-D-glucosamine N-deacetylase PgaB n=1 Tax=Herbaspirillum sp. RV1423 TaxID=1443993 RepID=UPI0004B52349|nr:poly-beta-1,6-N-acetyl-D-glucosamine N-deacetylase PgaB [Herbaspirillum sp. RV1423]